MYLVPKHGSHIRLRVRLFRLQSIEIIGMRFKAAGNCQHYRPTIRPNAHVCFVFKIHSMAISAEVYTYILKCIFPLIYPHSLS